MQKQLYWLTSAVLSFTLVGCGSSSNSGTSQSTSIDSTDVATETAAETDSIARTRLVINEVVANDAEDIGDWIELYVTGSGSINLSDYQITDENYEDGEGSLHDLPDQILSGGEYFRLYAHDESIESEYVVDFKLGNNDKVQLYQDMVLVDEVSWDKDQVLSGTSFGRFPDGSDDIAVLAPSVAATNTLANLPDLSINEILVSDDTGNSWIELYNRSQEALSLSNYQLEDNDETVTLPDATINPGEYFILYTDALHGDSPTIALTLDSEDELALSLNNNEVSYLEWEASDAPNGFSYGMQSESSWQHSTLSPTPYSANQEATFFDSESVQSIYITIEDVDWQDLLANPLDETEYPAAIRYMGVSLNDVSFRTKGNSSLTSVARSDSDRYSFKVDTNEFVDGQKLLNMKKFNLNNNFNDPSYMRETLAYQMMRDIGIPAPRTAFVNVYINNALHGLYTLVEQVDSEFLERNFVNEFGNLYKPDGTGSDLVWIDDSFASYEGVELKTNEDINDNVDFMNFLSAINTSENWEARVDIDSILKYLAVSTTLSNLDSYQGSLAHNYYLYEQDSVFTVIPWDLNESFGTFSMGCSEAEIYNLYIDEPTSGPLEERPLIARLMENDTYLATYHGYIEQLTGSGFSYEQLQENITTIKNLIAEHVANDPTAFYTYAEFENNTDNTTVGRAHGLLSFQQQRSLSIEQQLSGEANTAGSGTGSCSATNTGGMPPL